MLLQCRYDKSDPSLPCNYCERIRLPCGPKKFAPARERSQIVEPGAYTSSPQSPDDIRSSRILGRQNPSFVTNLQDASPWYGLPSKLSDLARQLEIENPDANIQQILELANLRVYPPTRPQATISVAPSIQQTPPGSANPRALSPFNTPSNGGSTQEQRRHSGSTRMSFPGNQWPQLSQASSLQGSLADNATPGSIQDRRVSQPQGSSQRQASSRHPVLSQHQTLSQHQVQFHNPVAVHPQGAPSPAGSFNNTSRGNTPTQHYQQSQSSFQAPRLPPSPQNVYPHQLVSGQQAHDDNQHSGLSSPEVRPPVPTPPPTSEVNPTQTVQGWYLFDPPN